MSEEWKSKVYHVNQTDAYLVNWEKKRNKRLKRDNYTCRRCGRYERLTVHHILPRADGGGDSMSNLITLCSPCHDDVEELGLRSRTLIENWGLDSERVEDKRIVAESGNWREWVYGKARRVTTVTFLAADLSKKETTTREVIIERSKPWRIDESERQVSLPVSEPKVKATLPPKPKQAKKVKATRVYLEPVDYWLVPDYPVAPEFVAGMYEYYAKRKTPVYVGEIFERWLMLETTKEWAVRNGRVLPVSIGFTYGS